MKHRFKMVVFDVDGTLVPGEPIWKTLHRSFGTHEHQKKHYELFERGEIKVHEWVEKDVRIWVDMGVKKDEIIKVASSRKPIKNLKETLEELKKNGFIIALVSGGLDVYLETILKDVEKYFDYIYINRLIYDNDKLVGVKPTMFDFEKKVDAVKEICKKEGIDTKDVVFVGDGINDIHVMKMCGLGIAINPKDDLGDSPDVIINTDDMKDILKFIL